MAKVIEVPSMRPGTGRWMGTNMRRYIKPLLLLAVLALGLYVGLRFMLGGEIRLQLENIDMDNSVIQLDGESLAFYGYNEKDKHTRIIDVFGSKKITIRSAGFKEYTTDVAVYTRGTKIVIPSLQEIPAAEQAALEAEKTFPDTTTKPSNPRYETDSNSRIKWLVYTMVIDGFESEVREQYDPEKDEWNQVVYGD